MELKLGQVVAARYRIDEPGSVGDASPAFIATDTESEQRVVLFEITAVEAAGLRPLVGVEHPHLCKVLNILEVEETHFLIFEHVPGATLDEVLHEIDHESPVEAVRSSLRVADAMSVVHAAGAVHGFLRPASVIVSPEGHPTPRLTFAPPLRGPSAYRSQARGDDGPPSVADDAWAVAALLHDMLLGHAPPVGGLKSEAELEEGIKDPLLRAALYTGLAADESRRSQEVTTLKRQLARWFVEHASEAGVASSRATSPPPLPGQSLGPAGARAAGTPEGVGSARSSVPPAAPVEVPSQAWYRNRLALIMAGVTFTVAVAAMWAYSAWPRVEYVPVPASSQAAASAEPPSIDLGDIQVSGNEDALTGDRMATCVAGYLPEGAFSAPPSLGWICAESDPRAGSQRLKAAVVANRPRNQVTEAMKIFSRLEWFEMAAYAVVYSGCCTEAKPLELPPPSTGCPDMAAELGKIGKQVVAAAEPADALRAFEAAARCESAAGQAFRYQRPGPPAPDQMSAFQQLVAAIRAD